MRTTGIKVLLGALIVAALPGCKTKDDLRREEALQRMQVTIQEERSALEASHEELKVEVSRLNSLFEELYQQNQALRQEVAGLAERVQILETAPPPEPDPPAREPGTLQKGKSLFDAGKYDDAIEVLKEVLDKAKGNDAKEARYLLAESYFGNKDYGLAALEFAQFRKSWPDDKRVAKAIYRQASAFRSLKKTKEAKLFYQELVDKFPKAPETTQAKKELKALK